MSKNLKYASRSELLLQREKVVREREKLINEREVMIESGNFEKNDIVIVEQEIDALTDSLYEIDDLLN